jgi:NADP-dependent 3-hydroxy acid dehydrogenase YdfG
MTGFSRILITGASSGIGAALARAYAGAGVSLVLGGRNAGRLDEVASDCRARGAAVESKAIDVADRAAMADWVVAADAAGPIDLVIANAGISPDIENARLSDLAVQHETMDINMGGVLSTVIPLLPRLAARRRGQIAVMASTAAFVGLPVAATYNASKAAVRVWGESLRHAMAPHGIGVTVICPGFVESRITERWPFVMPFFQSADRAAELIRRRLARNPARIAFPLPVMAGAWLVAALPAGLAYWLVRLVSVRR